MENEQPFHNPWSSGIVSYGPLESTWAWQLERTYAYDTSSGEVSLFHPMAALEDSSSVDMVETDTFDDPVLQFMQDILMEEDGNEHDFVNPVNNGAYRAIAKEVAGLLQEDSPSLHLGNMSAATVYEQVLSLQDVDAVEQIMGGNMGAHTFGVNSGNMINSQFFPVQEKSMEPAYEQEQPLVQQRLSQRHAKVVAKSMPQVSSQTFCENGAGTEIEFLQGGNECVLPVEKSQQKVGRRRRKGTRGKKQQLVDSKELLVQCAQFLGSNDYLKASDILKQLEEHVSQYGDGTQRVAYYFLEALKTRMSGSGGIVASRMRNNRPPASVMIKANKAFVAACPYTKLTHFFANQTILDAIEGASRLHVVDFGILYGFQWPSLMCALRARPNGPPFLRITGIDNPCPGHNPTEKLQDTGRRLEEFANKCRVPFDYKPLACRWETLNLDMLNIQEGEVVVVNCINRLRHVMDETAGSSARQVVLQKMRNINPKVFVFGVVSAGYNSPFFITRFKEAIHHFSAVFDSFENTMEREDPDRFIIESETLAHVIQGAVACEGAERIERPEKFKEWQKRCRNAGFRQLPLNSNIKTKACKMLRAYHKEFEIGVDEDWMLLGWKGCIVNALSTWCPQ